LTPLGTRLHSIIFNHNLIILSLLHINNRISSFPMFLSMLLGKVLEYGNCPMFLSMPRGKDLVWLIPLVFQKMSFYQIVVNNLLMHGAKAPCLSLFEMMCRWFLLSPMTV
jgi:hypothetical protein